MKHKFMLAKKWENQDPTGWFMSEKLDGVRALWTGTEFISRNGNTFHAPESFIDAMPCCVLDGELYGGRGQFQSTVGIVKRKSPTDEDWQKLKFHVFEAPCLDTKFEPKVGTIQVVQDTFKFAPIVAAPQIRCQDLQHMQEYLSDLLKVGAEGLMLRNPQSFYECRRSPNLLKVKVVKNNIAQVISHIPGLGKHDGRLGAILCHWTNTLGNSVTFEIGTGFSDDEREHPPELDSYVNFSYFELTEAGKPRFPVYQGKANV